MITGTYNLEANPSWLLLQLQEVRLECDTTTGPVTINLPAISTLAQSTNLKLIIVDATGNAATNNITINSGSVGAPPVFDTFDDATTTQLIIDNNGSSVAMQNVTSNQWIAVESIAGTTASWNLVFGNPGLGGDATVATDLQRISGTTKLSGNTNFLYNLKGVTDFDGSSNIYVKYLGFVTVDLGTTVEISSNGSIITATDTGLAGEIVSTLANGAWVTNDATGVSEQTPFVVINPDNTIGNPNEYYLYLLIGNPNNFTGEVAFDLTIATDSTTVTYSQNV
jgi:hypothetical protein